MMRTASSPDASCFILRLPWSRGTEAYNLGRPGERLTENCVATLAFGAEKMNVFPWRGADIPAELPLFFPPDPVPEATRAADYLRALDSYIEDLKEMDARSEEGKVVGARVLTAPPKARRLEIYDRLERLYPGAFVFYLSTPETGSWIGASPELLLKREGDTIHTVALAGTRRAGTEGDWDFKNVREQQMVTDFICETLSRHGLTPKCQPTETHNAGPVEHLITRISADVPETFGLAETQALVTDLSPTPALSGLPREKAMKLIETNETFRRHLYGGCIGRIRDAKDWCFFVNLRSALLSTRATYLYVGGGITALSEPMKEWEETELKSVTLLKVFAPGSIVIPGESPKPITIGRRHRRRRPRKF